VDDGSSVYFGLPFDRYPDLALFCTVWVTGRRPACLRGPRARTDPSLTGVYTLRSSDGGDLQRVTYDRRRRLSQRLLAERASDS
jgi:hypothetical protein